MLTAEQRERYLRHILLREVGAQGQQKLLAARVLIIGAGGIGAPLIQYLAAAGVGTIGIADDDEVELSNMQRQVIFTSGDIGAPKTAAAHDAVARRNPDVTVVEHRVRIDEENARAIVGDYDIVAEGIDSFDGRYAINRACIGQRRPLISAALGRFTAQLSVFKPYAGAGLPCYRCLAPEPPPREAEVNCAEDGVMGPVAGIIGTMAAMEVLKEILGIGDTLAGRLFIYDGLAATARTVQLPADPQCKDCSRIARA